jgi:type I pantothenate kinase
MEFITLSPKKFIRTKIPLKERCKKHDEGFISKMGEYILYRRGLFQQPRQLIAKKKAPFIVGFNGSVSSGKSRIATKTKEKINSCGVKCAIISTDNFIYPNKVLIAKKLLHRKGFPESYDWIKLKKILNKIKKNETVHTPFYDQAISDISNKKIKVPKNMDIIILEGINLLRPNLITAPMKTSNKSSVILSDFLDLSIYIDAPESFLKGWFYKRLVKKRTVWKKTGIKQNLTKKTNKQFKKWADGIWNKVNSVNLHEYILPFKKRADVVILKDKNHNIKEISFKV